MLTPAPKAPKKALHSCRHNEAVHNASENWWASENWFERYLPAGTQRAKRLLPIGSLILLSAIFPFGLTSQTPAPRAQNVSTQNVPAQNAENITAPAATTNTTPATSTSAPGASNDSAAGSTDTVTQPAPDSSSSAHSSTQIDPLAAQHDPLAALPAQAGHQTRIKLIVGGQTKNETVLLPLKGASVREALKRMGIALDKHDRVQPSASSAAYHGMTIRVTRVRADLKKRTQPIKAEVRYQPTATIPRGEKKTLQSGRPGVLEITERVWSVDGKVTRREPVGKRIAKAPQHTIIALGARAAYVPGRIAYHKRYARSYSLSARGGSPRSRFLANSRGTILRPLRSLMIKATAYTPDPRENGGYTRTATGLPIGYGAAAVDPRVIPLGTKLYIEGYGYAFACDTGGAIKGRRIDLAVDTKRQAYSFGRRTVKVWILGQ